jgi:carbonic anhydrase
VVDAFIIRTAGGRVRSGIKDLIFLDTFTQGQAIKDVVVIHHTGNLLTRTEDINDLFLID